MRTIIGTRHSNRLLAAIAAVLFATLITATGSARAATPEAEANAAEGVVNINTATVDQLRLLPRIGEEKAKRIIAHREKTPFKTVNELARVRGIGLKTLRALKPWLTISTPTTLRTKAVLKSRKAESESGTRHRSGSAHKGG